MTTEAHQLAITASRTPDAREDDHKRLISGIATIIQKRASCSSEHAHSRAAQVLDLAMPIRYDRWRHGGWYAGNVDYPSGATGCVSRNYTDKKWRIVCDKRDGDVTYPNRDAAARAEQQIAIAQWKEAVAQGLDAVH